MCVCAKSTRWIPPARIPTCLTRKPSLSLVFRGKFIDLLTRAIRCGKLNFGQGYQQCKDKLYHHKWLVSVRGPITQAHHVLEYLARYTHRVAIANSRLVSLEAGTVSFRYKDRKNNRLKERPPSAAPVPLSAGLCSTAYPRALSESDTMAFWPIETAPLI